MIKASVERIMGQMRMSEMPFPDYGTMTITIVRQHIGQCPFAGIQTAIAPRRNDRLSETESGRIPPGKQPRPCRRTYRRSIISVHFDPLRSKPVNIRSIDHAPMISDISPAQVIGQNHYNIRTGMPCQCCRCGNHCQWNGHSN